MRLFLMKIRLPITTISSDWRPRERHTNISLMIIEVNCMKNSKSQQKITSWTISLSIFWIKTSLPSRIWHNLAWPKKTTNRHSLSQSTKKIPTRAKWEWWTDRSNSEVAPALNPLDTGASWSNSLPKRRRKIKSVYRWRLSRRAWMSRREAYRWMRMITGEGWKDRECLRKKRRGSRSAIRMGW